MNAIKQMTRLVTLVVHVVWATCVDEFKRHNPNSTKESA